MEKSKGHGGRGPTGPPSMTLPRPRREARGLRWTIDWRRLAVLVLPIPLSLMLQTWECFSLPKLTRSPMTSLPAAWLRRCVSALHAKVESAWRRIALYYTQGRLAAWRRKLTSTFMRRKLVVLTNGISWRSWGLQKNEHDTSKRGTACTSDDQEPKQGGLQGHGKRESNKKLPSDNNQHC